MTQKQKIIARLMKWGWNEESATLMVDAHYEYVSKYYTGISKMAEVITCL
jgi:hypothetical protein